MDKSLITEESIVLCLYNSTVAVNDNNIGVAVIEGVAIGESVIYIQYRMITDSIAGENPGLHAVFIYKKPATTLHNLVAGIKE